MLTLGIVKKTVDLWVVGERDLFKCQMHGGWHFKAHANANFTAGEGVWVDTDNKNPELISKFEGGFDFGIVLKAALPTFDFAIYGITEDFVTIDPFKYFGVESTLLDLEYQQSDSFNFLKFLGTSGFSIGIDSIPQDKYIELKLFDTGIYDGDYDPFRANTAFAVIEDSSSLLDAASGVGVLGIDPFYFDSQRKKIDFGTSIKALRITSSTLGLDIPKLIPATKAASSLGTLNGEVGFTFGTKLNIALGLSSIVYHNESGSIGIQTSADKGVDVVPYAGNQVTVTSRTYNVGIVPQGTGGLIPHVAIGLLGFEYVLKMVKNATDETMDAEEYNDIALVEVDISYTKDIPRHHRRHGELRCSSQFNDHALNKRQNTEPSSP